MKGNAKDKKGAPVPAMDGTATRSLRRASRTSAATSSGLRALRGFHHLDELQDLMDKYMITRTADDVGLRIHPVEEVIVPMLPARRHLSRAARSCRAVVRRTRTARRTRAKCCARSPTWRR